MGLPVFQPTGTAKNLKNHTHVAFAARYSSRGQDEISNEIQLKKLREFKDQHGPLVKVYKAWEDVHSAFKGERPQLEEIYEDLRGKAKRTGSRPPGFGLPRRDRSRSVGATEQLGGACTATRAGRRNQRICPHSMARRLGF